MYLSIARAAKCHTNIIHIIYPFHFPLGNLACFHFFPTLKVALQTSQHISYANEPPIIFQELCLLSNLNLLTKPRRNANINILKINISKKLGNYQIHTTRRKQMGYIFHSFLYKSALLCLYYCQSRPSRVCLIW